MADMFTGSAPPSVDTTKTTTSTAPQFFTDHLSGLAAAGKTAMDMDPTKMVAGFNQTQLDAFKDLPDAATSYTDQLSDAQDTAALAASGATPESIQSFMNPYTKNVVDEMARLQQQNIQRNLMPSLKAGFVGTGGLGGQRYANALGQTAADWQSNLMGQQQKSLETGYAGALEAALKQAQNQNAAAQTQGALATSEQTLGLAGNKALQEAGAKEQALEQAKIDAPLTNATNAAALLRNYTIPTSSTETYHGPWTTYQPSPLSQMAGLGSLFASGANGTSAIKGLQKAFGFGD